MSIIIGNVKPLVVLSTSNAQEKRLLNAMENAHALIKDMHWIICNSGSVHKSKFYGGVTQISEPLAQVRTSYPVAYREFELNNKSNDWLSLCIDEGAEDLANKITTALFYGDRDVNPESINGLCKRMGKCNSKLKSSYNVLSAMDISTTTNANAVMGLKDLTSIYAVGYGGFGFYGLIPKNGSAVVHRNIIGLDGKHIVNDDEGNPYPAIEVQLSMDYGCCLHDVHFAARLANISIAALERETATFTNLWDKLTQIYERIRTYRRNATWSFYANPELLALLDLEAQKMNTAVPNRPILNSEGTLSFNRIPIQSEDAIRIGEDVVSESE